MRRENTTAWSSPTLRLDYGSDTANEPDIAIVVSRTLHSISRRHRIRCHRRARSASRADAKNLNAPFTFDRAGRMLTAASGRYSNTVTYTFDPAGRKASEALTISSVTYTIGQAYNARNELTTVTYPDSSTSTRSYHATGALNQLALDGSTISTRSYDAGRRLTSEVLGNGITETRSYRNDNLLSGISYSDTSIGNLSYTWDANKNKTSETITGVMSGYGFTAAGTSYDFEDRLTGFSRASGTFTQGWNLTSVGDWTSVTTNGTAQSRTHGPTHELLTAGGSNVTTDVKGNITTLPTTLLAPGASTAMNLAWDFDNKMKSADIDANGSADVNFQFDALGRRVARTGTGGSTVYLQMDQQTIADYPVGGTASTPTYRYVYASYIDEPVVRKGAGTGGTILYYHRNQQFSITAITTSTGAISERYAYSAYGQPTVLDASGSILNASAISNRYTYTGREWDATLGLHHFRARWMSPSAGRFLTRDTVEYRTGRFNLHEFINASPITNSDPSGNCTVRLVCTTLGLMFEHCGIETSVNGVNWNRWHVRSPWGGFGGDRCDVINKRIETPDWMGPMWNWRIEAEWIDPTGTLCGCIDREAGAFPKLPYFAKPSNSCESYPTCNSNYTTHCMMKKCGITSDRPWAPGWDHRMAECVKKRFPCQASPTTVSNCVCDEWKVVDNNWCASKPNPPIISPRVI
ncbi:MAG: RHS repeat-associated core domain-containing protein [Pirellula sp.]